MKKTTLILMAIASIFNYAYCQNSFCETFDQNGTSSLVDGTNGNDGTIVSYNLLNNWGTRCASLAYYDTDSQNGTGDSYLYLDDGGCSNGSSWAFNSTDYNGNWIEMIGEDGCFCYDFTVFYIQTGTINGNSLRIYDGIDPFSSTLSATFVLNSPIDVGQGWVRICAPIELSDVGGNLPENSNGKWVINTGNPADWDNLIQNVGGIGYSIDVASGDEQFGIDNICISNDCTSTLQDEPTNEGSFCCEGENLVENGNFEFGDNGFGSDYAKDPLLYPGAYSVDDNANIFGTNIDDHSFCADSSLYANNDLFLLINGKTTQPTGTTAIVWEQTLNVSPEGEYKLCANFKNMPQCTFDVLPEIQFEIDGQLLGWETINTDANDPCDWLQITECFTGKDDQVNIKILLKEDGLGDGNDLAIDDISVQQKLDQNLSLTVQNQGNPQQITGSINTLDATDDALLVGETCFNEDDYRYYWFVYELSAFPFSAPIDFVNMAPNSFSWSSNIGGFSSQLPTSSNPNWDLTTTFPNYTFEDNKLYVIGMYVPSCCDSCYDEAWSYQLTLNGAKNSDDDLDTVFTTEVKEYIKSLFKSFNGSIESVDAHEAPFSIYPNPVNDFISFASKEQITSYEIYDILGKKIQANTLNKKQIDVSTLSANMYFLNVSTATGKKHSVKFIKK